ncbi:hypothetical protein MRX96_056121 [Rhipicephalus microplus]
MRAQAAALGKWRGARNDVPAKPGTPSISGREPSIRRARIRRTGRAGASGSAEGAHPHHQRVKEEGVAIRQQRRRPTAAVIDFDARNDLAPGAARRRCMASRDGPCRSAVSLAVLPSCFLPAEDTARQRGSVLATALCVHNNTRSSRNSNFLLRTSRRPLEGMAEGKIPNVSGLYS